MAATPERAPLVADPPADPEADPMAITESERPVPERPLDPPFALVYDVVRGAAREREAGREEMRKRLESTHERYTGLAADAAVALHELRGSLEGEPVPAVLASIARRFATALDRAGVRFDDPVGEAYAAVGRRVDVAHAPDSGDESAMIVARTLRPGVLLDDGEVIRRAQVVLGFVPTPAQRGDAARGDAARGDAAREDAADRGPVEPGASAEPGASVEPEVPVKPEAPTESPASTEHETPVDSGTPTEPDAPAEPDASAEPEPGAGSARSTAEEPPAGSDPTRPHPDTSNDANHEGGTTG
ncbi:hypothetical protein [Embleya sp. NPDC001921]